MEKDLDINAMIDLASVESLLNRAREGVPGSLGQALETYRQELARLAEHELGSELRPKGDVSDLVQETFHKAVRDFPKFTGRTHFEWKAWLKTIFRHNLLHLARTYRTTRKRSLKEEIPLEHVNGNEGGELSLVNNVPSPSTMAMKKEMLELAEIALGRLKERDRQVLMMRLRESCTYEEIGRRLGCSTPGAKKIYERAVQRLRADVGVSSRAG